MPIVRDVFCPKEQKVTQHFVSVSKMTRELMMACSGGCEHFIKFPNTITPPQVTEFLAKYEAANKGQVMTVEEVEIPEEILNEFGNVGNP